MQKRLPYRNKDILVSAHGEPCTVCGQEDGTTVFCHLNRGWAGKGMGQKADDCAGFFGCFTCHAVHDGRIPRSDGYHIAHDPEVILRAYYRTIRRLLDEGVLQ